MLNIFLSNKLVDNLKCENESLKMHAKCLIAEPIAKKEENLCYNLVVKLDFVPIVSSISKDKLLLWSPNWIKDLGSQFIYLWVSS